MRSTLCIALAVLIASGIALSQEQEQPSALAVRIVSADRNRGDGPQLITLHLPSQHFHVVATNTSNRPIRLWREWCSWGYDMLSFRVTDENGKTVEIRRSPRVWKKNYADWTILQPGDHMVYEVSFDKETWPESPMPAKNESRKFKMSAVITVKADADAKREKVWTGSASSPEGLYTIAR